MFFSESVREQLSNVSQEISGVDATVTQGSHGDESTAEYGMEDYFDADGV